MHRGTVAAALALGALALASDAQAHVTVHPNVVPAGSSSEVRLRVPNESGTASTTRVDVQLPPGVTSVSVDPPAGWRAHITTHRLARPVRTEQGIDTEVTQVDFVGGRIAPGRFVDFPVVMPIPGAVGAVLTLKALQAYSDGSVSRWIGPPGSDEPAPTMRVSASGGPLLDVGTEGVPPAGTAQDRPSQPSAQGSGGGDGLAIAALVVSVLGLLAAGAALASSRRRDGTRT